MGPLCHQIIIGPMMRPASMQTISRGLEGKGLEMNLRVVWLQSIRLSAAIAIAFASTSAARAMGYDSLTCEELWQRRTEILHDAGLCFEGEKEIKSYGNVNCSVRSEADLKLTDRERRDIGMIKATEERKKCPGP
jgi:hypothetical protein